jgi:DNA repair and recombination protein RAD54B
MYRRQFVSPLLKRPLDDEREGEETLEKKARLGGPAQCGGRTPLLSLQVPNQPTPKEDKQSDEKSAFFNVLWRNPTTKKNKTWDGDGVLALEDGFLILRDSDGRKFGLQSIEKLM